MDEAWRRARPCRNASEARHIYPILEGAENILEVLSDLTAFAPDPDEEDEGKEESLVAQQMPPIQFEDIPLEEARRMSRSPRTDPELYQALTETLHTLGDHATRITLPEGVRVTTMKNRIPHVADRSTCLSPISTTTADRISSRSSVRSTNRSSPSSTTGAANSARSFSLPRRTLPTVPPESSWWISTAMATWMSSTPTATRSTVT